MRCDPMLCQDDLHSPEDRDSTIGVGSEIASPGTEVGGGQQVMTCRTERESRREQHCVLEI